MLLCFRELPGRWPALLLLLGLLLAMPSLVVGQSARIVADTSARQAPRPDSAAALRKLFAAQRRGNRERIIVATTSVLIFNYFLSYSKRETTLERISQGLSAGYVGLGLYNLGEAVVRGRRYRVSREKVLLTALAQGQPLPRRIRKKLVATYFKPKPATP